MPPRITDLLSQVRLPDPVDQMTARIVALNDTLRLLEAQSRDTTLQSRPERVARATLRREVHEELSRCCAPPVEIRIATGANASEKVLVARGPSEEEVGGPHAGL